MKEKEAIKIKTRRIIYLKKKKINQIHKLKTKKYFYKYNPGELNNKSNES